MVSLKKFYRPNFSEIQLYIFDLDQKLKHKTTICQLLQKELKTVTPTEPETNRHSLCEDRVTLPTVCGRYKFFDGESQ